MHQRFSSRALARRINGIVGLGTVQCRQPDTDLAIRSSTRQMLMQSPRSNSPCMLQTPTGSKLLPPRSAWTAPASMTTVADFRRLARIHFRRAFKLLTLAANVLALAPSAIARTGCMHSPEAMMVAAPAGIAIAAAASLLRIPPVPILRGPTVTGLTYNEASISATCSMRIAPGTRAGSAS